MNIKKSILAAGLALGITGAVNAQNVTYISGSTAFRSAANTAISNYAIGHGGALLASDNSTLGSAGHLLFNYTNGGSTNYIAVTWNGSEAGIQSAAGPTNGSNAANISYYATNATGVGTATNYSVSHVATLAFSDTYQSTSIFHGTLNGVTYADLRGYTNSSQNVGVVSFTFIGSRGFPTNASVTAQVANQILAAGSIPLTLITGASADQTNSVWLIGRNPDSGTRLTTLAEVGYGVRTAVTQYAVATNYSGGGATVATLQGTTTTNTLISYPAETINGVAWDVANSGYSSGGTLCGLMTNYYARGADLTVDGDPATRTGTNFLLGYAGVSDANGKTNDGLVKLAYNGVPFSTNAVAQGQYTFWGYEHLLVGVSANVTDKDLAAQLGTSIVNSTTATLNPNVALGDMHAGRLGDGQTVYSNY
jgi:hypothetical protein